MIKSLHPESIASTMPRITWQCSQTFSLHTYTLQKQKDYFNPAKGISVAAVNQIVRSQESSALYPRSPYVAWLSLFGGLDSGLECGTRPRDWTYRKLRSSSDFKAAYTPHYSILTSHELNSGQTAITRYQISIGPDDVSTAISSDVCAIKICVPASQILK